MRFFIVGTALLVLVLIPACTGRDAKAGNEPTAAKEGEEWTHKELLAYLVGKGLELEAHKSRSGASRGTTEWWTLASDDAASALAKRDDAQTCRQCPTIVEVQHLESAQKAREDASDEGEFSWGRFAFHGGGDVGKQIKALLPK